MRNGLYRVHFQTPLGLGAGVVVLRDGRLLGGDSSMAYDGDYRVEGTTFRATVNVTKHSDIPGMFSVLGTDRATLVVAGEIAGSSAALVGASLAAPGVRVTARMDAIDTTEAIAAE